MIQIAFLDFLDNTSFIKLVVKCPGKSSWIFDNVVPGE